MAETDENASTGEQAGRERSGSTSGDELAALSHAHRKRGPTGGQKTGSEVQSERDIKVEEDKTRKIGGGDHKGTHQQQCCVFCLENAKWTNHLIVSIANFTYLMLPHLKPVVPGHCCILPLQHELATRTVDNNVWEEIRNSKKCLIMMFAKQGRDVVFLETVMGLAQQHRHCLIDCVPLPQQIAKQAPLYFKKAIDEAEDEKSQHNAKKLIVTNKFLGFK